MSISTNDLYAQWHLEDPNRQIRLLEFLFRVDRGPGLTFLRRTADLDEVVQRPQRSVHVGDNTLMLQQPGTLCRHETVSDLLHLHEQSMDKLVELSKDPDQ